MANAKPLDLFVEITKSKCPHFKLDAHNEKAIRLLIYYYTNDRLFLKDKTMKDQSFEKGIMLAGNVGTGKTLIFEIVQELVKRLTLETFGIISCRQVAAQYEINGYQGIAKFGRNSFSESSGPIAERILIRCFDDFGSETIVTHFGNKVEPMREVLMDRYEMMRIYKMKTHLTTNLDGDEIKDRYGERTVSRLREMFNYIVINGPDRRK